MTINPNDPFKPNEIWAKDPGIPVGRLLLHADAATIRLWAEEFGSEAKMGEYCGLVHGVWRNGDVNTTLTSGLLSPKAIFKGLNRPLFDGHDTADRHIYIYITNPSKTYSYPMRGKFSGGPLADFPPPVDSVFATYVSFNNSTVDEGVPDVATNGTPSGRVVGWEWLEQSGKTPGLPYDYDSRFESRVF